MKQAKTTHGGARPGAGRKSLSDNGSVILSVRVTPEQKRKFLEHLGADWLRERIDRAK